MARKTLVTKKCIGCGIVYQTTNKNGKFHSIKCAGIYRRKTPKKKNPPTIKCCEWCHNNFEVPFAYRKKSKNCCSRSCSSHLSNSKPEVKIKAAETLSVSIENGYCRWGTINKGHLFFAKAGKEVFYRSGWEKRAFEILEIDDDVKCFEVEPVTIPYFFEKQRNYTPDILVSYKDGVNVLVEVKPKCHVGALVNIAKFNAARKYCAENGMKFEVWTQDELGL